MYIHITPLLRSCLNRTECYLTLTDLTSSLTSHPTCRGQPVVSAYVQIEYYCLSPISFRLAFKKGYYIRIILWNVINCEAISFNICYM